MSALLDFACESLKNSKNIYNLDELPIEYKIILTNKCNSLLGILKIIGDKTEDSVLKEKIEKTSQKIGEYKDTVAVKGLEKGDKRFYDLIAAEFIFGAAEWAESMKSEYDNFKEKDLYPYPIDDDIPF